METAADRKLDWIASLSVALGMAVVVPALAAMTINLVVAVAMFF